MSNMFFLVMLNLSSWNSHVLETNVIGVYETKIDCLEAREMVKLTSSSVRFLCSEKNPKKFNNK